MGQTNNRSRVQGDARVEASSVGRFLAEFRGLLAVALASLAGSDGMDAAPSISAEQAGYVVKHWGIEDGLPLDRLTSLAQTPDGLLWIGTDETGLTRFDGNRFVTLTPDLEPNLPGWTIFSLMVDSQGRLWVNARTKLSVFADGDLRRVDWETGGPVVETGDGEVLMHSWNRLELSRFRPEGLERIHKSENHPWPETEIRVGAMEADSWRRVWGLLANGGDLFRVDENGTEVETLTDEKGNVMGGWKCFLRFPDGRLGLMGAAGLYECTADGWRLSRRLDDARWETRSFRTAMMDSRGAIWMAPPDGSLYLWPPDGIPQQLMLEDGPFTSIVRQILVDQDETIWLATHSGLYRFRPAVFGSITPQKDWRNPRVFDAAAARDGSLWFAASGQLNRVAVGSTDHRASGASRIYRKLAAGRTNELFGAVERDLLRARMDPFTGELREELLWTAPANIAALHWSDDTGLWIGTISNIFRLSETDDVPERMTEDEEILQTQDFEELEDGRLLVLTQEGEVFLGGTRPWQRISPVGWATGNEAVGMARTAEGDLWIAHRSGLLDGVHDGVWRRFSTDHLALPQAAMGVESDLDGGLWWNTLSEGIVHLDATSARALASGETDHALTIRFGLQDGLLSLAGDGYEQTPVRDGEGRMWFPSARGISFVSPDRWRTRASGNRVLRPRLESVHVDGRKRTLQGEAFRLINVPAGASRIDLDCSVVELGTPERCFLRYRLVGYDADWTTTTQPREITYQKLPPGSYELHVCATGEQLEWSEPEVLASLMVHPFWWQRWSVRVAGAALLAGALILWVRGKFRRLESERRGQEIFSRQLIESQENERHRIARDLHDGLGQSLSIARNQLHLAEEAIQRDSADPDILKSTNQVVDAAIADLRGIAYNLRPHLLDRLGLTRALEALATQTRSSCSLNVRLVMDPVDGVLPPEDEIHLYRVIQELLNNVIKHADASEVDVRLYLMAGRLHVDIQDDGKGYDSEKLSRLHSPTSGMGLAGVRERIKIIGGEIEVESILGQGTEVRLIIPLKR